jgi:hypothetical protein
LLTSLTFYGGVNEIGGNKILLEDRDTRVFLDFGKGFRFHNCKLLDWFAELNSETSGEIDEKNRMNLSRQRVHAWKVAGYYPTVTIAAKSARRKV